MLAISFEMEFLQGVTISIEIHKKTNYFLLLKVALKKKSKCKIRK